MSKKKSGSVPSISPAGSMDAQNCVTRPVKGTGAGSAGEGKSVKDATSIRKKAAAKGNASEAAAIPWTATLLVAVVAFAAGHFLPKAFQSTPLPISEPTSTQQQQRQHPLMQPTLTVAATTTVTETVVESALPPLVNSTSTKPESSPRKKRSSPSTSYVVAASSDGGLGASSGEWPLVAEDGLGVRVAAKMEARLEQMLVGTYTNSCRTRVRAAFEEYVVKSVGEDFLPFELSRFPANECNRKAPKGGNLVPAAEIRLVYLLLVHEQAFQTLRLIESLWEPQHHFLIHMDAKNASAETYAHLKAALSQRAELDPTKGGNVHLLADEYRTSVSWGGYNVVQATLNGFHAVLHDLRLDFHWLVTMSGYTYPLMSNADIRARLSQHPDSTNFFEISPAPNKPAIRTWHDFIECDDAMRRVWRLAQPQGISMYAGSQWFIASRAFVRYAAPAAAVNWPKDNAVLQSRSAAALRGDQIDVKAVASSFVVRYAQYATHIMVADENFFSTVLKNSAFCHTHENQNMVHVQFDQWEHEKPTHQAGSAASANKCLMPNPNHCGRSPTVTTLEYLPVLDLADVFFARKFDPTLDHEVLDAIDDLRSMHKLPNAVPSSATLALQAAAAAAANEEAATAQSESTSASISSSRSQGQDRSSSRSSSSDAVTSSSSSVVAADDECSDAHANCRDWASMGECDKNPAWMLEFCAYSCGSCHEAEEQGADAAPMAASMATSAATAATTTTTTTESNAEVAGNSSESVAVAALRRPAKKPNYLGGMVLTIGAGAAPGSNHDGSEISRSVDIDSDSSRGAVGSWDGLLCVQMANRRGARATLQSCAPDSTPSQTIDFGPCSQDGSLHLDEPRHRVVTEKGTYAPPFCLAQVAIGSASAGDEGQKVGVPAPAGKACFDVEREQVITGAKLIHWPCQKTKWNQLFSFSVSEGASSAALASSLQEGGSLYINIPFAHHRDKHMCVTVASVQAGAELELSPCRDDNHLQRFMFHRASVPPRSI